MDSQLPPLIDQTMQSILAIVIYLIMIGVVIHWFLVAMAPLTALFIFTYMLFRGGSRDLQRLQNMSLSPMLSHLTATIQGLSSVHAYDKVDEFTDRWVQGPFLIYLSCYVPDLQVFYCPNSILPAPNPCTEHHFQFHLPQFCSLNP